MTAHRLSGHLSLLLLMLIALPASAQSILYVDQKATGANNGTSFKDAFVFLQDAMAAAQPGTEIRVAAGVYRPDQGSNTTLGDREASFYLKNGVRILGGFDGTPPHTRDWQTHTTVLSGDLLENDSGAVSKDNSTRMDNSLHVVIASAGTDTSAVLDGFVIQGGHAIKEENTYSGAGLEIQYDELTEVRLSNLVFENNLAGNNGGGVSNSAGSLWLSNVSFINNTALHDGGAIYHQPLGNNGAFLHIDRSYFEKSKAGYGGALYTTHGGLKVTSSVFFGNEASAGGVAMHRYAHAFYQSYRTEILYANTLFLGNKALSNGGAFCNEDRSVITIYNSVFSGNQAGPGSDPRFTSKGGAIVNFESSSLYLYQTTFTNNTADEGGAIYSGSGDLTLYNSIMQDNQSVVYGAEDFLIYTKYGSLTLAHNLLDRPFADSLTDAGGNQIGDALFVDALGPDGVAGTLDDDFHLQPDSPAIEAGNNALLATDRLDLDLDGDTTEVLPLDMDRKTRIANGERIINGQHPGMRVDLGPYEFNAGIPTHREDAPFISNTSCPDGSLTPAYPNPFSATTNLTVCVSTPTTVQVYLYDMLGRRVAVLFDRFLQANQPHPLTIERSNFASGMYFVRLQHASGGATQSILLTP